MSEWIKMRPGMRSHAKVTAMARSLLSNAAFREYALGSAEPVTSRVTFDLVTRVTVASLLDVWGAINHVVESDDTVPFMISDDVDQMAGLPGFATAMEAVGWLLVNDDKSLSFPNFGEFNVPESERKKPLSGAERARRHRAKKKAEPSEPARNERNETSQRTEQNRTEQQLCPDAPARETPPYSRDADDVAADTAIAAETAAVPTGQGLAFGEIVTVLQTHGIPHTWAMKSRRQLVEWSNAGVHSADIAAAIGRAVENKRDGPIGPAYLDPIIKQVVAERLNPEQTRASHGTRNSGRHRNAAARATASLAKIATGSE